MVRASACRAEGRRFESGRERCVRGGVVPRRDVTPEERERNPPDTPQEKDLVVRPGRNPGAYGQDWFDSSLLHLDVAQEEERLPWEQEAAGSSPAI